MEKEKNKPAHTVRGTPGTALEMAIWRNDTDKGPRFSVSAPTHSYKTDDGQWKQTTSIPQSLFLEVGEMYREARQWVIQEQARLKAAGQARDAEEASFAEQETQKRAGGRHR